MFIHTCIVFVDASLKIVYESCDDRIIILNLIPFKADRKILQMTCILPS